MTEKLRNIEAAWSDVFLKKKKNVYRVYVMVPYDILKKNKKISIWSQITFSIQRRYFSKLWWFFNELRCIGHRSRNTFIPQ